MRRRPTLSDVHPIAADLVGSPAEIQWIGNHFSEAALLALGHRYQRETDWRRRVPPKFEGGV